MAKSNSVSNIVYLSDIVKGAVSIGRKPKDGIDFSKLKHKKVDDNYLSTIIKVNGSRDAVYKLKLNLDFYSGKPTVRYCRCTCSDFKFTFVEVLKKKKVSTGKFDYPQTSGNPTTTRPKRAATEVGCCTHILSLIEYLKLGTVDKRLGS